ncbi:transcriptional regulator, LysR family [Candidatus Vecturithrix granuli]|uniref:Transcriptional regulator, LysR family n=1 Tax=Vecturithrix granuli TaxID=1499967 RepID=A0A081C5Y6_VECG1|nr:transcriptional regulator, LysR family [Candidatus Vecturithrix granuli]
MELRQLKTFRTVATLNSFHQAAAALNCAQSTVSEQIKALETDLDVALFRRAGKQIALTEAGELLLRYAQKMLDLEAEVKTEVPNRQEHYGTFSIRIPETLSMYYLPPIFKTFHQRFPRIRFYFNSCAYYSLQQELQSGITNLAFLIMDTFQAAQVETEVLFDVPLVLVAHPDHPLASQPSVSPQDLKGQLILLSKSDCSYRMLFERMLTEEKIESALIVDFSSTEAMKQCLMAGLGLTIIPEIAVRTELAAGRLVVLPWQGKPFDARLLMIWHKQIWISPILQAFMDMIRATITLARTDF